MGYPPVSKASRKVENFIKRKHTHAHILYQKFVLGLNQLLGTKKLPRIATFAWGHVVYFDWRLGAVYSKRCLKSAFSCMFLQDFEAAYFDAKTYRIGANAFVNRIGILNAKIPLNWLSLSLESFKIKCKKIFFLY